MRRSLILIGLLALAGAHPTGDAQAASGPEKHGAWEKRCETPPGAASEQCYVVASVQAAERPNVTLVVIVLTTADRKARLFRVIAPLGVLLPPGVGLSVGGQDFGVASYVRCLPNGCIAEAQLDEALLAKMQSAPEAALKVFQTPEEGIAVDLPLDGFKDAFAALP